MARKTLDKWIEEAISDADKPTITHISLVHMRGLQQLELHTYRYGGTTRTEPRDLAAMFRGKAEAYCQDLPGVQTFQLMAFYGKTEAEAFQPFLVNQNTENQSGLSTEAPTEQGRLQQIMRQGEALMQQVYRRQQTMDEHSIRMIEQQSKMIGTLMTENMSAFQVVKDLLVERGDNSHKRQMEALQFQRATQERKKWMTFAPALINQIMGREVFPQSTADSALIETAVEHLDEATVTKLAETLPAELWGPLASRLSQSLQKKNDEEQAMRQLPQYKGSPEDDITGGT